MRIAIQSHHHHHDHEEFHLRHQGMWFLLMLIVLLMLLGKTVGSAIGDRPASNVEAPSRVAASIDVDDLSGSLRRAAR